MEIIYFAANVLCNPQIAQVSQYTATTLRFPAKKFNNTPPLAWFICFWYIVVSIIIICLHVFVLLKQKECWQPEYSRSCSFLPSALFPVAYTRLVKSSLFPWVDGFSPMLSFGSLVSSALSKGFSKVSCSHQSSIFLKGFAACGMFWYLQVRAGGWERSTTTVGKVLNKENHCDQY